MKHLLNNFAVWLWTRTHVTTATEVMLLHEADNPMPCEHCGLPPIHYLKRCPCKKFTYHLGIDMAAKKEDYSSAILLQKNKLGVVTVIGEQISKRKRGKRI